jgi:hypothetical protein
MRTTISAVLPLVLLVFSPDAKIRSPPRRLAMQEALDDSEHVFVEQGLAKEQIDVQTILFRSLLRHMGPATRAPYLP